MKGFFLFLLLISTSSIAQNKYEFRAAWVATIGNIDWPSSGKLDAELQKQEFINILEKLKALNMNAVIVQVRPVSDAFYVSSYETWSKYISGAEGTPPNPYYDPLEFMIAESHKRGIEFHAWFNPYRALVDANKNTHAQNHPSYTNPDWFVNYGGKKYFDPGVPEVRKFVQDVVCEVVKKYDIDAVHFDDYFYPYKIGKQDFPDQKSYNRYGLTFYDRNEWRRNNVNLFIQEIHTKIKAIKPTVQLGISPFGVWRNIANDPDGSNTRAGVQNYDDLNADVIMWQKKGWIDYLMPQLYWERGHKAADFYTLCDWWNRHAYNRAMYIGQGLYQLGVNKASAWKNPEEITEQIKLLRQNKNINGYSFYSANYLFKNKYSIIQKLQNETNTSKAIVPPMKWLDNTPPLKPFAEIKNNNSYKKIIMKHLSDDANCFVIYRFLKSEKIDISQANKILEITGEFFFNILENTNEYKYAITSLDKTHNESDAIILDPK